MSDIDRLILTAPQKRELDGILAGVGDDFDAVVAYGSRATGQAWRGSDLDLAVINPQERNSEAQLWLALEESQLPFFFDLTLVSDRLESQIRQAILRDGVPLAGKRMDDWRSLIP